MADLDLSFPLSDITCCPDLYHLPLARYLLGESWHPGGLALTRALAKEMQLTRDHHLLDVACGRGASAMMLAQVYTCRLTGLDADPRAIEAAHQEACRHRLNNRVSFILGEATLLPFPSATFSGVLCECSTSLFSDKPSALREMARTLRPSGTLALSELTFGPQTLPPFLPAALARVLCIPVGMGPESYLRLLEGTGFRVRRQIDCTSTLGQLLDKVEALLSLTRLARRGEPQGQEQFQQASAALEGLRRLVQQGDLGYWAFVAARAA